MPRTPTPPRKRPQPQQDTQNSMFSFFRKTDEELPEPKRLICKQLEEQVASLTKELKEQFASLTKDVEAAQGSCSLSTAKERKTAFFNDVLRKQVAACENTCDCLQANLKENQAKLEENQAKLKENQAKLKGCEDINGRLHLANSVEAERNDKLNTTLIDLKTENNTLHAQLLKFEGLAERTEKVYLTNKSLEEENERLNVAYKNIGSEMEKLKQTTRTEIAACESKLIAQGLAYNTLLTNRDTVKDAFVDATKAFMMQKKRKLDVEQSSAGASLPIADVVSCYATETSDRCVMTKGPTKGP